MICLFCLDMPPLRVLAGRAVRALGYPGVSGRNGRLAGYVVLNVTASRIGAIAPTPGGRRLIVSSSRALSLKFAQAPIPVLLTVRFCRSSSGQIRGR